MSTLEIIGGVVILAISLITIVLWACSSTLTVMYTIKTALKMLQVGRGIPVYPYISFIEFSKLLTPLFLYICSRGPEEAK